MKIILLDGSKMCSVKSVYEVFSTELGLSDRFGRNLDALHDVLSVLPEDVGVIAVNVDLLKEAMGRRWASFLRLMRNLEKENERFFFCFDPFANAE